MEIDDFLRKENASKEYLEYLVKDFNDVNPALIINVLNKFYSNNDYVANIAKVKNINPDFIIFNDLYRYKMICIIISNHYVNLDDVNASFDERSDEYASKLAYSLYEGLLLSNNHFDSTIFLSNPIIANAMNISNILNDKIKKLLSNESLDPIHKVWCLEIKNILDSFESMFILLNKNNPSQAMGVFRQALQQYITMKAVEMNPNSIDSFLEHQDITIKEALHQLSKEDLDKYLEEKGLNYNNYKSYLNYGWLDTVEEFKKLKQENPKTKYNIKMVAVVSNTLEFYEAMDFASNYVHSNFVFINMNWNIIIREILDGVYSVYDWIIDSYVRLFNDPLIINGFEYIPLYISVKEKMLEVLKNNEEFDFHIE